MTRRALGLTSVVEVAQGAAPPGATLVLGGGGDGARPFPPVAGLVARPSSFVDAPDAAARQEAVIAAGLASVTLRLPAKARAVTLERLVDCAVHVDGGVVTELQMLRCAGVDVLLAAPAGMLRLDECDDVTVHATTPEAASGYGGEGVGLVHVGCRRVRVLAVGGAEAVLPTVFMTVVPPPGAGAPRTTPIDGASPWGRSAHGQGGERGQRGGAGASPRRPGASSTTQAAA